MRKKSTRKVTVVSAFSDDSLPNLPPRPILLALFSRTSRTKTLGNRVEKSRGGLVRAKQEKSSQFSGICSFLQVSFILSLFSLLFLRHF